MSTPPDMVPTDPTQIPETQEEALEVDAREKAAYSLIKAIERLSDAAALASADNMSQTASDYALAVANLGKTYAVLAPIEAADDLVENKQPAPSPAPPASPPGA